MSLLTILLLIALVVFAVLAVIRPANRLVFAALAVVFLVLLLTVGGGLGAVGAD